MKKQLVIASALLSLASLMGGIVQALPQFGAPGNSKGVQKNAKAATWSVIAAQLKKMFDAKPVGAYASGLSAAGPILTKYYYITKTQAEQVTGNSMVGDNNHRKNLLRADFATPTGTKILGVNMICSGPDDSCTHTFGCDPLTCQHMTVEFHGNNATWWGVTDNGDENQYAFAVQYQ